MSNQNEQSAPAGAEPAPPLAVESLMERWRKSADQLAATNPGDSAETQADERGHADGLREAADDLAEAVATPHAPPACVNCGLSVEDAEKMRAWKDSEDWKAYPRVTINRAQAAAWFLANGFVAETGFGDEDRYGKNWSSREGMGDTSLEFIPHDYGWSAIVGSHASGTNPRMGIGTCATVQDIARTTEAVRLINGYKKPDESGLAAVPPVPGPATESK